MIEAAAKYKRIVQVGSQGHSQPFRHAAIKLLREGAIGRVYLAKGLCYKRRVSIGHKDPEPVPPGIDWDQFLGPAPMRAFTWNRFRYNWHWFWETGNGDIGNQGVHEMDFARWGLGRDLPPPPPSPPAASTSTRMTRRRPIRSSPPSTTAIASWSSKSAACPRNRKRRS